MAKVPLFAECSKAELHQIAAIADEIYQPAGSWLTLYGTTGREFFVLIDGKVAVSRDRQPLATLTSGDFFGEIALIMNVKRSATVTATTNVRLLVISRVAFQRLLREVPSIQGKLLQALATRLAEESM